ncbi:MAG: beta-lactamase family protein [Anaerolineae bacterium]|nr:beta-lactamase family protein [Anaerolineae bacterium]
MASTVRHELPRTAPERQGIASDAVLQFVEALESRQREIHSVMLLRHGSVIAEGWWSPYGREHRHMLFSLSKSFTSTAVGLALAEGRFSIDDTVLSFFPEQAPARVSDYLAAMRVRHLLSMTTGHTIDTWPQMAGRPDDNWIRSFFSVPMRREPGTHFLYNTGATYMLSAIVQTTTGMKLMDYLEPRLFEPLGIEDATWQESPQGIALGGIGLSTKTEDIARFGQLYLQKGLWQGAQLLPQAWVEAATAAQVSNRDGTHTDWTQGYGYQFWRCRHGAYRGDGVFGQYCVVMPEQDAVLAITGGIDALAMQGPLDLVWNILLPALRPGSLPDNPAAHEALANKLSSLSHVPVQGQATAPTASRVSGQTYAVDTNALQIETIALDFTTAGCVVSVRTAAGDATIACGYGLWQRGENSLFNRPWLSGRTPVATSGAWTAEDTFTMIVRLYETPFFHTLHFHFAEDELMIESRVNVSLESVRPLLLTARRAD